MTINYTLNIRVVSCTAVISDLPPVGWPCCVALTTSPGPAETAQQHPYTGSPEAKGQGHIESTDYIHTSHNDLVTTEAIFTARTGLGLQTVTKVRYSTAAFKGTICVRKSQRTSFAVLVM